MLFYTDFAINDDINGNQNFNKDTVEHAHMGGTKSRSRSRERCTSEDNRSRESSRKTAKINIK